MTVINNDVKKGINRENLDTSVNPREDFYSYACGGWMKRNPLTAEFSRYGVFDKIRENNKLRLRGLVENISSDPESKIAGTVAQKISDLFAQGMDMERRNREGASPLLPMRERIAALSHRNLEEETAWIHGSISSPLFSSGVGPDFKDSTMNIMHIGEAGLSLGDRDYYLVKSEENSKIWEAWERYVKRIMELCGHDEESQERIWLTVSRIETEIATRKMTREDRRDPLKRFNPMTLEELKNRYPGFDWSRYFKALGVDESKIRTLNVSNPAYMEFISSFVNSLTDAELRDYFEYDAVAASSGILSDDFYQADFELYDRVMSGKKEPEQLWKRALTIPNSMLGEAVGQIYVKKYFPEENKHYMQGLVENLRSALGDHIRGLEWMSPATKQKALEKLAALKVKIGYPDKWKDYSGITINPSDTYLENVRRASQWYIADNYSELGKPVDKSKWFMTPQTVNAYYSPLNNEICFPAGILQPPYFDPEADDAINYGAIGVVIGHEMTHGFDDQGRRYDASGNLHEWWTPEDSERFNALTSRLVSQFDAVEVLPGLHANGTFTLGENIADQGGLRVALTAYSKATGSSSPQEIDGFSPLQRFYLGYASVWAANIRPEEMRLATVNDPHSLGRNRVNVTLRNISPFMEAFGIREEDGMFRPEDERVIIW